MDARFSLKNMGAPHLGLQGPTEGEKDEKTGARMHAEWEEDKKTLNSSNFFQVNICSTHEYFLENFRPDPSQHDLLPHGELCPRLGDQTLFEDYVGHDIKDEDNHINDLDEQKIWNR